jgi:hypothetical protein
MFLLIERVTKYITLLPLWELVVQLAIRVVGVLETLLLDVVVVQYPESLLLVTLFLVIVLVVKQELISFIYKEIGLLDIIIPLINGMWKRLLVKIIVIVDIKIKIGD